MTHSIDNHPVNNQRGNLLFMILIAVVLIGLLTAAVMNSDDSESSNIDDETLVIRASEMQRYGSELERAVNFILQNGYSESDILFAHPNAPSAYGDLSADTDKSDQVFARIGGGASYRNAPDGIAASGSNWEFYGHTALPSVGSSRADLIAVLPNVTAQFCAKINAVNGQGATLNDTGTCLYTGTSSRFSTASPVFAAAPNTVDETTFAQDANTASARTALQACVTCTVDSTRHFYHVILAR